MGETLRSDRGVAAFARAIRRLRLITAAYLFAGCAIGLLSVPMAVFGAAQVGVDAENPGGLVLDVLPGSQAWKDGIRAGQTVVGLDVADSDSGWRITARSGAQSYRSSQAAATDRLRSTTPLSILAGLCAIAGLLAFSRRAQIPEAWSALALALAAAPAFALGTQAGGDVGTVIGLVGPALWTLRWRVRGRSTQVLLGVATTMLTVGWVIARDQAASAFEAVDVASLGTRLAFAGATIAGIGGSAVIDSLRRLGGPRSIDVAAAVVATLGVAGSAMLAPAFLPVSIAAVVVALVFYPRWRAGLGGLIDHFVIADMRERASLDATEQERSRLARDLHDVPLQELSGVIRRMELRPELSGETGPLRAVADELRAMATSLRPPVLEDLGLGPALDALRTADSSSIPVSVDVDNRAGYQRDERAPLEVEVAVFRVAQEAVRNAQTHSSGLNVWVTGSIERTALSIDVADDGVGLTDDVAARSLRRGRLGIPSMRRRMTGVGGSLELRQNEPRGLRVRIRWPT